MSSASYVVMGVALDCLICCGSLRLRRPRLSTIFISASHRSALLRRLRPCSFVCAHGLWSLVWLKTNTSQFWTQLKMNQDSRTSFLDREGALIGAAFDRLLRKSSLDNFPIRRSVCYPSTENDKPSGSSFNTKNKKLISLNGISTNEKLALDSRLALR